MLRLDRGGAEFLIAATDRVREMGGESVFSPALYPDGARVWRRAGYDTFARLTVMERSLDTRPLEPVHPVTERTDPDWDAVFAIDRSAFDGFWRMSMLGLREAHATNKHNALLTCHGDDGALAGFAIVGTQWGVTYLHRIAVRPEASGRGFGGSLLAASITWGRGTGGRTIVLNVRDENAQARRVYEASGFLATGTQLQVLRYPAGRMLN